MRPSHEQGSVVRISRWFRALQPKHIAWTQFNMDARECMALIMDELSQTTLSLTRIQTCDALHEHIFDATRGAPASSKAPIMDREYLTRLWFHALATTSKE